MRPRRRMFYYYSEYVLMRLCMCVFVFQHRARDKKQILVENNTRATDADTIGALHAELALNLGGE